MNEKSPVRYALTVSANIKYNRSFKDLDDQIDNLIAKFDNFKLIDVAHETGKVIGNHIHMLIEPTKPGFKYVPLKTELNTNKYSCRFEKIYDEEGWRRYIYKEQLIHVKGGNPFPPVLYYPDNFQANLRAEMLKSIN